jgi:hypothetical protein
MGFHQSGSSSQTLPFMVPSFGFFALRGDRTNSTTGSPRRQIVTVSPLSARLISAGSL